VGASLPGALVDVVDNVGGMVRSAHDPSVAGRIAVLMDLRFLGAVVALAVNDHVLKGLAPGWLTGKLSDVSGVFVATVVLGVVLRPRLGAVAAMAGFAAIKLSATAAELAVPLLGGLTRQDPGDLVALVAVVPAYRLLLRHRADYDIEGGFRRAVVVAGSLVAVMLTVSATSCLSPPFIDGLAATGGVVYAHIDRSDGTSDAMWAASSDGGRTWAPSQPPPQPAVAHDEACGAGRCWRVIPGRRVEEQEVARGPFRTVVAFSEQQRDAMELRAECGVSRHPDFSAVTVVNTTDGVHVVVAMGPQGALHRSPAGRWERRPVLDLRPLRSDGSPAIYRLTIFVPLGLLVTAPLLWLWGRRRPGRHSGVAATVATVGGVVILAVAGYLALGTVEFTVTGPVVAALAIAVFVAAVVIARRPVPPPVAQDEWPAPAKPDPTSR
jgi:hypothetical protein